jgi:hypothetical protein
MEGSGAPRGGRGFGRGAYGRTASPAGRGFGRGEFDGNPQRGGRGSPKAAFLAGYAVSGSAASPVEMSSPYAARGPEARATGSPSDREVQGAKTDACVGEEGQTPARAGVPNQRTPASKRGTSPGGSPGGNNTSRANAQGGTFYKLLQQLEEHPGTYSEHMHPVKVGLCSWNVRSTLQSSVTSCSYISGLSFA